jgi:hypothetical protein
MVLRSKALMCDQSFCAVGICVHFGSGEKKGQSTWIGPFASSDALDLAQGFYRQQANICRQHSISSPQQLLAAKVRAEPDSNTAPTVSLRTLFFIVISEN